MATLNEAGPGLVSVEESDATTPVVSRVKVLRDEPRLKLVRVVCREKWPDFVRGGGEVSIYEGEADRCAVVRLALPNLNDEYPPGGGRRHGWSLSVCNSDKNDLLIVAVPLLDYVGATPQGPPPHEVSEQSLGGPPKEGPTNE